MPSLFHVLLPMIETCPYLDTLPSGGGSLRLRLAKHDAMAEDLDVAAMLVRFRARADAVRKRPMPPIEGADRKRFVDQARVDYMDYAMIGDAEGSVTDGVLTLTVDLRPPDDR